MNGMSMSNHPISSNFTQTFDESVGGNERDRDQDRTRTSFNSSYHDRGYDQDHDHFEDPDLTSTEDSFMVQNRQLNPDNTLMNEQNLSQYRAVLD